MDAKSFERRHRPGLTPRLLPAWAAITIAGILAVAGAIGVYLLLTWLLDLPQVTSNDENKTLQERKILVEAFKAALGVAAGLGAVVALALSYRRHRIEESQSHRDDQRLFTDAQDRPVNSLIERSSFGRPFAIPPFTSPTTTPAQRWHLGGRPPGRRTCAARTAARSQSAAIDPVAFELPVRDIRAYTGAG